VIKSHLLYQLS